MPEPTLESVHLLPWEQGSADTGKSAQESLFDVAAQELGETADGDEPEGDEEVPEGADGDEPDPDAEADEELDEGEEEDPDEEDDGEERHEVKLPGGKKERVTLDELKAGYSRNADYTQKTQALAETRKAVEAETATLRGARERYEATLTKLEESLTGMEPQEPDWDKLREEDPAEYAAQREDWRQLQQDKVAVQQEKARIAAEKEQEYSAELRARVEQETVKLLAAIPEWADEKVAKRDKTALAEYAKSLGYTDEELGSVYDHRIMVILRRAMLHDKGEGALRGKRRERPALAPGSRSTAAQPHLGRVRAARKTAMDTLAQSGRVQDAARAIETML